MAISEFVVDSLTESAFSLKFWQSLFFVKLQPLLWMVMTDSVTESVFSKASDVSYKHESFTKNGGYEISNGVWF